MDQTSLKLKPGRRRLLKLIAAAGGGVAASAFLPARWLKPVVRSGVLPAHAQTSQLYSIVNSTETFNPQTRTICATCFISPLASALQLKVVVTLVTGFANGPQKTTALPLDPILKTSVAGAAEFDCLVLASVPQDLNYIDFEYSFVNSSQCAPAGCTFKNTLQVAT